MERTVTGTYEEIPTYQRKYTSLLDACSAVGSMVLLEEQVEKDRDIAPFSFFRQSDRQYLFPPLCVKQISNTHRVLDPSPGHEIRYTKKEFRVENDTYDHSSVRIKYEDADCQPKLTVRTEGKIPEPIATLLHNLLTTKQ